VRSDRRRCGCGKAGETIVSRTNHRPNRTKRIGFVHKAVIVIPCLNERAHIGDLISWILQDTASLNRLIVVTDGGSTDGTGEILAEIAAPNPCVKVISNRRKLQSAGMKLGGPVLGEGRQWLVRLDAHAAYPKGYVASLIAEARRTDAASVVVSMVSQGTATFPARGCRCAEFGDRHGGAAHRRSGKPSLSTTAIMRCSILKQFIAVGGYDESLSHNEDAESISALPGSTCRSLEIFPCRTSVFARPRRNSCTVGTARSASIAGNKYFPRLWSARFFARPGSRISNSASSLWLRLSS